MNSQTDSYARAGLKGRRTNLPAQLASMIGRERELETASAYLRGDTRLLTLSGPAGVGKTRLALQVAARLLSLFVDGISLVELAPIRDPDLVSPTIAHVLGIAEERGQPLLATIGEYLRNRRVLLLLDNFEHLIGAVPVVADLLAAAPSLSVMVTSREVLRIYGEQEFPVPPLELPDPERLPSLSLLDRNEAIALFVARTQLVKPDFQLTNQNARIVAEICQQLDGLPLAIELAAARCKILPPAMLLARLDNRLGLLEGVARVRIPRQQTLRDAIAWSYDLLEPDDQVVFVSLAVFRGGCTLAAAQAVCGKDEGGRTSVIDRLISLVDKSLLRRTEDDDDTTRFSMLETIREYALEQLAKRNETAQVRYEHAAHFLQLAEQAEPELIGAEQTVWLARLDRDHDNFRAALQWAMAHNHPHIAARMAGALWRFWHTRGHLSEGRRWLEQVLARSEGVPTRLRARALDAAGILARDQGDYAHAQTLHQEALALYHTLLDSQGVANALNNLGAVASKRGEYGPAQTLHEEALRLCRELGDRHGEALALNNLGIIAGEQGDYTLAQMLFTEALSLRRALGDRQSVATALLNLGFIALLRQNFDDAAELTEECLALQRELGGKRGVVNTLVNLGTIALIQDKRDRATALFSEGLALGHELGDARNIAYSLEGLAGAAGAQGQIERAARLWGAAAALRAVRGLSLPPAERAHYEAGITNARALCDQETWTLSWTAGRDMTLAQAIEEALA